MRRTAEDAAKTRLALLEAALMAFEEKGWRGATFEHVAERAGVTRGALHHHFRSKTALLSEALEWGWTDYGERLFASEDPDDAQQWLVQLLSTFVRLLREDTRFRALASATVLVAPQALSDDTQQHHALDTWRHCLEITLEAVSSPAGVETVAGLVLVLLQGFTVTAVSRPEDLPAPENLDAAMTALARGLMT